MVTDGAMIVNGRRKTSSSTRQVFPVASELGQREARKKSAPSRQDCLRLHDLFCRTGKIELKFSRPARDQDFDGVQAAGDHPEAELFVDFAESMLLEAIAHAGASVRDDHIAMLNDGYLKTPCWGSLNNSMEPMPLAPGTVWHGMAANGVTNNLS